MEPYSLSLRERARVRVKGVSTEMSLSHEALTPTLSQREREKNSKR
jgi:hypothetical protein